MLNLINIVPSELTPREPLFGLLIGVSLFASLIVLSLSKLVQSNVFYGLLIANLKFRGVGSWLKESFQWNGGGSVLLMINYFISTAVILYVISSDTMLTDSFSFWMIWVLPIIYFFWPILSMFFVGILTGEKHLVTDPMAIKLVGAQLLGIYFFVLSTVNALYHLDNQLFLYLFVSALILESAFRYIKSFYSANRKGGVWYYLILYFCTLEILPLFVVAYVLREGFIW